MSLSRGSLSLHNSIPRFQPTTELPQEPQKSSIPFITKQAAADERNLVRQADFHHGQGACSGLPMNELAVNSGLHALGFLLFVEM